MITARPLRRWNCLFYLSVIRTALQESETLAGVYEHVPDIVTNNEFASFILRTLANRACEFLQAIRLVL